MPRKVTKRRVGELFESLPDDVLQTVSDLVKAYRDPSEPNPIDMIKGAVDVPADARARVGQKIADFDAKHGAGSAVAYINGALTLIGSSETAASIDATIAGYEAQALTMVDNVNNNGWSWDQVADWLEANMPPPSLFDDFSFYSLPRPPGRVTVWGDPV